MGRRLSVYAVATIYPTQSIYTRPIERGQGRPKGHANPTLPKQRKTHPNPPINSSQPPTPTLYTPNYQYGDTCDASCDCRGGNKVRVSGYTTMQILFSLVCHRAGTKIANRSDPQEEQKKPNLYKSRSTLDYSRKLIFGTMRHQLIQFAHDCHRPYCHRLQVQHRSLALISIVHGIGSLVHTLVLDS